MYLHTVLWDVHWRMACSGSRQWLSKILCGSTVLCPAQLSTTRLPVRVQRQPMAARALPVIAHVVFNIKPDAVSLNTSIQALGQVRQVNQC